ncbi:MAG TPA: AI-2E family transporter [Nevskiaceae bacterium]|nr:AI-2E family transporter [Nevskiaceae bacterium]
MSVTARQYLPWAIAGIALLGFLWALAPILPPFVIGAGLAYLGDPIVDRLQRRGFSRTAGCVIVFAVLTVAWILALLLLVPMLYRQVIGILHAIPDFLRWLEDTGLPKLGITLPPDIQLDPEGFKQIIADHWSQGGGAMAGVWNSVTHSGAALVRTAAEITLIPVATFYLLRDWDDLVAWIAGMIPPRHRPLADTLARETDTVLGAFLRGQLSVMVTQGILYSIGLTLIGLKLGLLIGLLAGLVSFVPYLGFFVGVLTASAAMVAQQHEFMPVLWVLLVFSIGHALEHSLLVPTLVGDKIGLHPVAVMVAVLAGAHLFGFVGILLGLPVAAVLAVLLRHAKAQWLASSVFLHGATESVAAPPAQPLPGDTPPDG